MLKKMNVHFVAIGSLLLAAMWMSPVLHAAGSAQASERRVQSDNQEVADLLNQAKTQAAQLSMDAADMESFPRSNVSWEGHAEKIMQIREDVNTIGKTAAKLNNAASEASPWQKTAVGRINPLLKELADNTTSIIVHLTKEQGRLLNTPEHKDLLQANADMSSALSGVVTDFVNYGEARAKYQQLKRSLEVSEHDQGN